MRVAASRRANVRSRTDNLLRRSWSSASSSTSGTFSRFALWRTSLIGFPPTEDPNVGPTLPLFALHASLLIPCSPRHDFSCRGATNGREITPPEHPVFVMGKQTALEIVGRDDQ